MNPRNSSSQTVRSASTPTSSRAAARSNIIQDPVAQLHKRKPESATSLMPSAPVKPARLILSRVSALLLCLTWTTAASAAYVWQQTATTGPSPRYDHAMVYESSRHTILLFGGRDTSTFFNDVWEWDSSTAAWTNVTPQGGPQPTARYGHAMAYDVNRNKVVLFGGWDATGWKNDTWEWAWNPVTQTGSWTLATPANNPPARMYHGLAYDPGRGQLALYGGTGNTGALGDTWEWDGASSPGWVLKATYTCLPPPGIGMCPRFDFGMTYNGDVGAVVLFGGTDNFNCSSSDPLYDSFDLTFRWDGSNWAIFPQSGPAPSRRFKHELVWDNVSGDMVLHGGTTIACEPGGGVQEDTWTWRNPADWGLQNAASQEPRAGYAMAFDETIGGTGGVILHGGYGSQLYGDTLLGYAVPGNPPNCPPQFSLGNPSTWKQRVFVVTGTANGTPWAWSISWGGYTIYEPNVAGVTPGAPASALAAAFVASINSHCPNDQLAAYQLFAPYDNQFRVIIGGNQSFSLCVGPAGQVPTCCVSSAISCQFNPVLSEFVLSGEDCNMNGEDDAIDLLYDPTLDGDEDGVIDSCQPLPGDLNCDGAVNGGDIAGLVQALIDPIGYGERYPDCNVNNADLDGDGQVTVEDIGPAVERLLSGE